MIKPRILLLSTSYLPLLGGSELAIRHLTDCLTGYDFDMVTARYASDTPQNETVGRIRVFRAGGRWARLSLLLPKAFLPLAIAFTALRLMRRHPYALVHAYQASQAAGAGWLLRMLRPRMPFVLTLQEGKLLRRQFWLTRLLRGFIVRSADRVTAISRYLMDYARSRGAKRVVLVPNGVDCNVFTPAEHASDAPVIVSVSRLVEKNGLEALIRAIPVVIAAVPEAKLTVVGTGTLAAKLEQLVTELRVSGAVNLVGPVPHEELPGILRQSRVFARPSLSEGFGSAFLEAMACGLPVVASARGGITDFVTDGRTGLFCDPEDPRDIADKLIRVLSDVSLREHLRANGLKLAREYDWNRIASQMDGVYSELISPKSEVQS